MLFNSVEFLFFLPLVFLAYWYLFPNQLKIQNLFLIAVSYLFYGWWNWQFLSLIVLSSFTDFFMGQKIYQTQNKKHQKYWLYASLVVNLGILGYFKYANFFIESFEEFTAVFGFKPNLNTLQIILPVGISFYTFQTLSYTIDVFNKKLKPTQDFLAFFAFVAFFPQLVAGPIERAKNLLPQFFKPRKFNYHFSAQGGKLMLYGFFKKVVIADNLAPLVDLVYNSPENYSGLVLIFATLLFALQIYCDFSGYSDIAIGTARLLGFNLMTNFNFPYFSTSFKTFWQRWHISLSTWFRDYVYIPLGGSKNSTSKTNLNTLFTFIISGLWHGANFTFVIWGFLHGLFLVLERYLSKFIQIPKPLKILLTFLLVCLAWVFFRAHSLQQALFIISQFASLNLTNLPLQFRGLGIQLPQIISLFILLFLFGIFEVLFFKKTWQKMFVKWPQAQWFFYSALLILIAFWGFQNQAKNFIYFQF